MLTALSKVKERELEENQTPKPDSMTLDYRF